MKQRILLCGLLVSVLSACTSTPQRSEPSKPATDKTPSMTYLPGDGPSDNVPANIDSIPNAVPKKEPLHPYANRPYVALGKSYTPLLESKGYKERGVASWYGKKFHGQRTSSGEIYDMFGMTAAHPTLPIPSYVRVTNPANRKSVVVRVNDRGPFLHERVIDLSYTAAYKLGISGKGSGEIEIEGVDEFSDVSPVIASTAPTASANPPVQVTTAALAPAVAVQSKPLDKAELPNKSVPVAKAEPITTVAAPTSTANTGSVYLQLGAFKSQESAQSFLEKMRNELGAALGGLLNLYNKDGVFRVHLGPYTNQAEARKNAESLQGKLGFKPVLNFR